MADQTTQRLTVTIDEAEQDTLWDEIGSSASGITFGKYCWDFVEECRQEYYLVRKSKEGHKLTTSCMRPSTQDEGRPIDYRSLLSRYIQVVTDTEGIHFLGECATAPSHTGPCFTQQEIAELYNLFNEGQSNDPKPHRPSPTPD